MLRLIFRFTLTSLALLAASIALPERARAAVIITVSEVNGDVVVSGSGTLNLAGLTGSGSTSVSPRFILSNIMIAGASGTVTSYQGATYTDGNFRSAISIISASSSSGTTLALSTANGVISVSSSYVSGSELSFTSTYNNQTLSSLKLITGTYVWSWGSGDTADSITLIIGSVASAVPEPGTLSLFGLGLGGLGLIRRRQRRG
jgi:hypothetical protein